MTLTEVDETALFDEVRRFKVHDDTHGGYLPAVIGYWDRRGYTYCLDHAPETLERDDRGYPHPVDADNSAAEGDRCDWPGCGVSLLAAALDRRSRREHFPSTCKSAGNARFPLA